MSYENLPGINAFKIDGNLGQFPTNANPVTLVIGTAEKGDSDSLYSVSKVGTAAAAFGRSGTLTRGMYEAAGGGALNIALLRVGATPAILRNIGGGITITTVAQDDSAGTDYKLFWDDSEGRLFVYRASDDTLVYDNYPAYPEQATDLGEVAVSGQESGVAADIGTSSVPITLAAAAGVGGATYVHGSDGLTLSRMQLWEELYKAYKLLDNAQVDFIVPMNAFLDDANLQDKTTAQVTTLNTSAPWASQPNYPTPGTAFDVLGKVFVQEYAGEFHFWWSMDRTAVAKIFPNPAVGSSSATTDADGTLLTTADFHEVNFAYDLARFCFEKSENDDEVLGFIGCKPPTSFSLADVAVWVGQLPTFTTSGTDETITTNGTGLLGNKFMAGRLGNVGTGLPAFTVDGLDGRFGGGLIAKDDVWLDSGTDLKDANDKLVDLGKYISVVGAQAILSNGSRDTAYTATGAVAYAGFVSSLAANSAPTNKVITGIRLPFRISVPKLDSLAGQGYVMFATKQKGVVVSDAPTAARSTSDYRRLTTVRIVKAAIDAIRSVGDPFLGEGISGARLAALDTAIEQVLVKLTKAGFLQRYDKKITSTPQDQVIGKIDVDLTLVPAFEIRKINVSVSLAAQ